MKATVYTMIYTPFCFGSVWQPQKATIEVESLVDLGKGFKGYVFRSAKDKWHVASKECGALVGHGSTRKKAIDVVKKDIAGGDITVMKKQVKDALNDFKSAKKISEEQFLSALAHSSGR